MYGVIGSTMSAQLNVAVEPSQWLESRSKRQCLEAKNVKEKPMPSKHATNILARVSVYFDLFLINIIVNIWYPKYWDRYQNWFILVDCTWNDWELGECSVTCAGGTRVDTRTVATEAMHGGFCDPEGDMRVQECNPEACPGKGVYIGSNYSICMWYFGRFVMR